MKGTRNLLKRLYGLRTAIEKDVPNAIRKEVEERRQSAEEGFNSAEYDGDGERDVTVSMGYGTVGKDHYWDIIAEGRDVLFIEYGTGIKLKHDSQFGEKDGAPDRYAPRSWSLGPEGKGWLSDKNIEKHHGQWPYGGLWTDGTPSANVMYDTKRSLKDNLRIKARKPIKGALK